MDSHGILHSAACGETGSLKEKQTRGGNKKNTKPDLQTQVSPWRTASYQQDIYEQVVGQRCAKFSPRSWHDFTPEKRCPNLIN